MIIDEGVYLAHHGIKGMRWGVRNEDRVAKRTAKRERKAAKFDARAAQLGVDIKAAQAKYDSSKGIRKDFARQKVQDLKAEQKQALSDAEKKRQGKLSSTQKKVLIGASVAGTIVAAAVTYKTVQSGDHRRIMEKGKAFVTGREISFKKKPILADPNLNANQIHDLVVKKVNPDYGDLGTKMNCRRCTFAYELRRRGFDVEATRTTNASGGNAVGLLNATTPGESVKATGAFAVAGRFLKEQKNPDKPTPVTDLMNVIPGGARSSIPDPSSIFKSLAREPNGSRGELGVMWPQGGGHSMAYEIINGVPHIFDAQSGKKYTDILNLSTDMPIAQAAFTRLDNIPLNPDFLLRWVKDAK